MASKQVIETNKLKIGSSGMTGLYVGSAESKYAVMTDANKAQTVIYDKVTYNFAVNDLANVVPASGGTYNITASQSTRTHGNGVVDNVSFSPTSITIPANTGDIYSSAITVTQASSNLTDQFNFTVTGEVVTQITLSIGDPSVIPASGGTVNNATTSATVYYSSGRQTTSFTPAQVKFNSVSANSKGTTVSNQTSAGTLTCYIVFDGVTSNTVSKTVYQQANAVTASGCTEVNISSPSGNLGEIAASGGSKTPTKTSTGGMAWSAYTSTSTAQTQSTITWAASMTAANGFSINTSTGVISASSKGTTMSNQTTSNTATLYAYTTANGQGRTASTTYYATQALNHIVSATATTSSTGTQVYYANIGPGATYADPTKNGAAILTYNSGSTAKTTSNPTGASIAWNRTYQLASSQNGFTAVNASSGRLTATSLGTTISNARTSANITCTLTPVITHTSAYGGAVITATSNSCTVTCTQNGNYVTSISVASQAVSIANIPAGGGSKTPTGSNGTVTYTFSSNSTTTTTPGTTYGALTSSVSYAMTATGRFTLKSTSTGEVSATTKGTTIENVTNANTLTKTVSYTWTPATSYNAEGTKTCSGTATCTPKQDGNYVSSLTITTNPAISYGSVIPAAGGSITPTGGVGAVSYNFTSGSNSTTAPSSTYGALTTPTSYSMATGGDSRITLKSSSTGELTGTTKGTTVVDVTSSGTVTKTVTYTWTPTSSYNAGGTITKAGSATAKGTQAANAITGYTDYQNPTGKSIAASTVPAAGGTATITWSGTAAQNAKAVYTSTSTASTYTNVAPNVSTAVTGNSAVSSKGTTISNATTAIATVTGYYWANGKTASTTCSVTQAANHVTSISVASQAISYAAIPAGGGSKTPTGSNGTVTYTFTSTSTSTSTPASSAGSLTSSVSYAMTDSGRFTLKSTSTGEVSATTKGTTIEGVTSSNTVTKTVSYTWTPASGYNATGTKTCSGTATNKATQAANAVVSYTDYQTPTGKSISGSQVHASGGTSTITWSGTAAQNAKAVYTSTSTASTYTNVAPNVSTAITGNSAVASKGTTVSNVTTARTVTGYYWANGKTASTTCYVTQGANSHTDTWNNPTVTAFAYGTNIPAAGGSVTPTSISATQTGTATFTSTSTASTSNTSFSYSYAMTASGRFSLKNATTGEVSATTRGTTTGNAEASPTVTVTCTGAGSKTATKTATATQAANSVTSYTDYQTPTGKSISGSQVPAAGGTSTITWAGTAAQNAKPVYSSNATGSSYVNVAPSVSTAVTGNSSVASKGTTVSNVTTALTVTGYYWANGKTASTTCYVTQAANAVVSYTDYQNPTGKSIAASTVPAAGGTSTITWSGTAAQNAKPVYTSTSTGSSYVNVAPSVSTAVTGNSAVSSKGTTISNATTAIATVTGYYWANGKTASTTCSVTQAANYVTAVVASGYSNTTASHFSYANVGPGATSAPVTLEGTAEYTFSSGSKKVDSSASPSFGGSASYSRTYTLASSQNGFTAVNANNGTLTCTSLGTTISNARTSANVTGVLTVVYTHASGMNGGSVTSTTYTKTNTCTQNGNYVTSIEGYTAPTIAYSVIPAGGGSVTPTGTDGGVKYNYSSGASGTTAPASTYGTLSVSSRSYAMASGGDSRITLSSTSTGQVSGTSKGTTVVGVTSSGTITKTVSFSWTPAASYNAAGTKTCQQTCTVKATQAANALTGYCDYQNPTGMSISASQVPANGGTSTITWAGTCKQNAKAVYTSNSTASSYTELTVTPTTAVTGNSAVGSKGTTVSNATTAIATVTGTYTANGKSSTTTCSVTQAANYVTSISVSTNPTLSYSAIPASGGTVNPGGSNGAVTYTFSSTSTSTTAPPTSAGSLTVSVTWSKASGGASEITLNTSNGAVTAASRGTTTGTTLNSGTITKAVSYSWAHASAVSGGGTKTASKSATATASQAANALTGYCDYQNPTGMSISASQVPAGGGTSTITWAGTCKQNAKAVYTSNASATTYTELTVTPTTAVTGNSAVASKGTTLSNATTAIATVTGTYTANGKSSTTTCSVTQAANYVTNVEATGGTSAAHFSYADAGAGATSVSPSLNGAAYYTFSSGTREKFGGTSPSFGGSATYTRTYSLGTSQNGFNAVNASTGALTCTARGTTVGNARTSGTVTGTLTVAYTHPSGINGSNVTSAEYTSTATCTQAGNYVTSLEFRTNPAVGYSTIPAAGGTVSETSTDGAVRVRYTSGSSGTTFPGSTYGTSSQTITYSMTNGSGFYLTNTSTGKVSADTKGTTISNETTSNTITESVTFTWTPTSSYNAAGTKTVTKSATGNAVQAGNYVTGLTVTTTCTFSGTIPASGGSISESGGDASITAYKFSSGASSSSAPGSTYGTSGKSTTWSMTNGNGFTLDGYTVTAADRGTTTGSSRNSNTITETATATWTPKSPYTAAGTITATATDTDYCVQEANEYTYQVGVVNVTSPKGKIDEIDAGGGTATATQSAWQAMASGYTATGLDQWTNTTFTWYYNKSNNAGLGTGFYFKSGGGISASSRGSTTGSVRTSSTVTVYAAANGATGNATYYATQEANSMSESYGNITITSPIDALNDEFSASGGTQTPTFSAWQACSKSYTSGSGSSAWTNTTFTWYYNKSNNAALGTGFYFKTGGGISASSRGTTTGYTRTSSTVTAYAAANGKTGSTTYFATQEENLRTLSYGYPTITSPAAGSGSNLGTIAAGGGSKTPTLSAWQACSDGYTSGASSSAWTNTTFTWTFNKNTGASLGTGFYLNDNVGTITAVTRGTTTGTTRQSDSVTAYAAANGKTGSTYYYVTQAANNVESISASGVTISFTYTSDFPASGGTKSTTAVVTNGTLWPVFTSGSKGTGVSASYGTSTYSVISGGGSVNTGNGTLTVGENTGTSTITHKVRRTLSYCGKTVTTFDALINQAAPTVTVTVASSISALNGGTYYGSVMASSNGANQLSSDFRINTAESLTVPATGFTATKGPAGSVSAYGSGTLTAKPYMTITRNGQTVASNLPASEWSSQQAMWYQPSVNITVSPGDVFVCNISY